MHLKYAWQVSHWASLHVNIVFSVKYPGITDQNHQHILCEVAFNHKKAGPRSMFEFNSQCCWTRLDFMMLLSQDNGGSCQTSCSVILLGFLDPLYVNLLQELLWPLATFWKVLSFGNVMKIWVQTCQFEVLKLLLLNLSCNIGSDIKILGTIKFSMDKFFSSFKSKQKYWMLKVSYCAIFTIPMFSNNRLCL